MTSTRTAQLDPIVHGAAVSLRMDQMQEWKIVAYLEKNARAALKRQEIRKLKLFWWTDKDIVKLAYIRAKDYCEAKLGYLLAKQNRTSWFDQWSDDFRGIVVSFAVELYDQRMLDELEAKA